MCGIFRNSGRSSRIAPGSDTGTFAAESSADWMVVIGLCFARIQEGEEIYRTSASELRPSSLGHARLTRTNLVKTMSLPVAL